MDAVTFLPLSCCPCEVKKQSFQELKGLCSSQGMHEEEKTTSVLVSYHLESILQILTQGTSLN